MTYVLSFDAERQNKARKYFFSGLASSLAKNITILALTSTAIGLHLSVILDGFLRAYVSEEALVLCVFILIGFGLFWVVSFPFSYYKEYALERKYELSTRTLSEWFRDKLKTSAVSLILVLAFFEVAYNFTRLNLTWIFIALAIAIVFLVFLSVSSSAIIETHLHDSQKLKDKELLTRFAVLVKKAGLKNIHIYEMKAQKKTKKAIADSSGTANARKISLSDTLLNNYSIDEIESIIGHEIGHHKHGHQLKFSLLFTAVIAVTFVSTYQIVESVSGFFNLGAINSITSLPLVALFFGLIYWGFTPLTNTISRWAEGKCDQYELDLVKKPNAYLSAIMKFTDQNLGYAFPNPFTEFIFYDHPSAIKRAKRALKPGIVVLLNT